MTLVWEQMHVCGTGEEGMESLQEVVGCDRGVSIKNYANMRLIFAGFGRPSLKLLLPTTYCAILLLQHDVK